MRLNTYQERAQATANHFDTVDEALMNAALGLAGESGEFADHIKKVEFHGHDLDSKYLAKELGDILWYIQQAATALGYTLDWIAKENLAKLAARYPEGFSEKASRSRKKEDG